MNRYLTIIVQPFVYVRYYTKKRNNNIWVFGEWVGKQACDNSLYLANYVCNSSNNIQCYFVTNKNTNLRLLDKKIKVIYRDSKESKKIFKKAGVVIFNQNLLDFSSTGNNYFGGALLINLWHGSGNKKIHFDTLKFKNFLKPFLLIYKKLLMAEYYLAPSEELEKKLKSAFFSGEKLIREGQPRNTLLFNKSLDIKLSLLKKLNMNSDTKIISYLPTFRDKSVNRFIFTCEDNINNLLEKNDYIIIQKKHPRDKTKTSNEKCKYIYNSVDLSTQEILQISDILITDYSSCAYDFLIKDKPIIHFLYDHSTYISSEMKLYHDINDIRCGDICYTYDELLKSLESYINNECKDSELRLSRKQMFISRENINNSKNIYNSILKLLENKK